MQNISAHRSLLFGLTLGSLLAVAVTASPAQAQTTSVGPYYAMPAWDQAYGGPLTQQEIGDIVAVARSYNNLGLLNWKRGIVG